MVRKAKELWKRRGLGSMMLNSGQVIEANQTFAAREEDIPKAFRDLVEYVGAEPPSNKPAKPPIPVAKKRSYKLSKAAQGWWNVIDTESKKPANSKQLRKPKAEALLKQLSA